MDNTLECTVCDAIIELGEVCPVLCYVCPKGHVLCEKCNDSARGYCLLCGVKTTRKWPNKKINELFRTPPQDFSKKSMESKTLILSEDGQSGGESSVIGSGIWALDLSLPSTEKILLEMLMEEQNDEVDEEKIKMACWNDFPKPIEEFVMHHGVMNCPITKCGYTMFNSDATIHLVHSHESIPIEILGEFCIGDFFFNTWKMRKNEVYAGLRILVPDVVRGLGSGKYKDHLPLYVLGARIDVLEMNDKGKSLATDSSRSKFERGDEKESESSDDMYMRMNPWTCSDCILIWCAGNIPLDCYFRVAISVYPEKDNIKTLGSVVKIRSLHLPQNISEIYNSTDRLMVTATDIYDFSKGDNVLDGQIRIM